MGDLDQLRKKINKIDKELINLLSERRKISKEIISAKNVGNNPIRDPKREAELLKNIIRLGEEVGMDSHFITRVFIEIVIFHRIFVRLQNKLKTYGYWTHTVNN